jgi:DHA1 family tetracycline resistance protein-like MFS transporter
MLSALSDAQRLRVPFYFCCLLGLVNWLYGFFVLPESLPPEKREPRFNWKKANPFGSFQLLNRHRDLLGMGGVLLLFHMAQGVFPAIFILLVGYRYNWTQIHAGFLLMAVGLSNVVVQLFLTGPAFKRFHERGILLIGLLSGFLGMAIYAFAPTGPIFLIGIPVAALFGFVNSGLQGLMTRRVEPWEQGQLQGANSAIQGMTAVVAPLIYTQLFHWSILAERGALGWKSWGAAVVWGAPILLAAGFTLAAYFLAIRVAKPVAPPPAPTT